MDRLLKEINQPGDLKKLDVDQLSQLAREIRRYLVEVVSNGGGHLSSNLGVVELSIALHYCFDSPKDKMIWDVGHQSYVHKILTGRREALKNIRKYNGISGFPKTQESQHDSFNTGHSSTSISAALGFASARDLLKQDNYVISIIGDGALTGGLAFEALNNASNLKSNFIVILNDNQMSISENVGGISLYLDSIRTAGFYHEVKEDVQKVLRRIPKYGEGVINAVRDVKDSVKQLFVPGMFFEEMGFTYLGPIEGHNIRQLITTLNQAKKVNGPTLIHINTTKGKGYKPAEAYPTKFHGTKPFEKSSGDIIGESSSKRGYSEVFGHKLKALASADKKIVAITAAMPEGTGLQEFSKRFPKRFFDVGIAEQHAVTFAAGIAMSGLKPFVPIYSTFLQRAYDQLLHDVCLQKLPVVFGVDRSGLVGEDGETHQGVFDTSYLNHMPNMTIMAPKNTYELEAMMDFAAEYTEGPIAIKYPRGNDELEDINEIESIEFGKAEYIINGKEIAIIAVGSMLHNALEVCNNLSQKKMTPTLINARFVKPVDTNMLLDIAKTHNVIAVIEENTVIGGYGSRILEIFANNKIQKNVLLCGIEDEFVSHGSRNELLNDCGLSIEKLTEKITACILNKEDI